MANKENRGRDIAIFNFTGRLVADAEVRTNKSGKKFATYTVASQTFSQDHANFYNCTQGGDMGWLKKGMPVAISGVPEFKEFTDKEGHQRKNLCVRVRDLTAAFGGQNGNDASKPVFEDVGEEVDEDDDLPF